MTGGQGKKPLISVIVPVYNSRKTIERTLESILSQTYPALEILLVDDGSRDNSLEICRALAEKDGRVRVISRENGGCARARNSALDVMTGDYVLFVDSDDILQPDACETLLSAIGENALAIAHYFFELGQLSAEKGLLHTNGVLPEERFFQELVRHPGSFYFSALWNKLYRADVIREHSLRFDPFFDWGEDFAFNMCYYHYVEDVSLVDAPVYHYRKSAGSTSLRTLLRIPHSIRIKYRLYKLFRDLYVSRGQYTRYRWLVSRYIFNVTLSD